MHKTKNWAKRPQITFISTSKRRIWKQIMQIAVVLPNILKNKLHGFLCLMMGGEMCI